jgi:hypothetical protein
MPARMRPVPSGQQPFILAQRLDRAELYRPAPA